MRSKGRFFVMVGMAALAIAASCVYGGEQAAVSPDKIPSHLGNSIRILDPSFEKYLLPTSQLERLDHGFTQVEGPVWLGDMHCLLFTDIPNDRIMKWDNSTGASTIFRDPANFANGLARDRNGRLLACEHGRRVTRTEYDGSITVLADSYRGKKLNSPNDLVVKSDGSIWFTDPTFGVRRR